MFLFPTTSREVGFSFRCSTRAANDDEVTVGGMQPWGDWWLPGTVRVDALVESVGVS